MVNNSSRLRRATLPAVILTAFTLAACGGGDDSSDGVASLEDPTEADASAGTDAPTATTEPVDMEQAMLEFASCMRSHGVDMPDPTIDENGGISMQIGSDSESGPPPGDIDKAMEECDELMPRGPVTRDGEEFDATKMQDEMLAFAQCMREHGVDMPDPEFDEDGRLSATEEAEVSQEEDDGDGPRVVMRGPFGTLDLSDAATSAAFEECSEGTLFAPGDGAPAIAVGPAPAQGGD